MTGQTFVEAKLYLLQVTAVSTPIRLDEVNVLR